MEPQKTSNSQSSPEKEEQSGRQTHSNQIDKNKVKILKETRGKQQITHGNFHKVIS